MAQYIVRVELHENDLRTITKEDYDNLHEQMRSKGFVTTIVSSEPKIYKLLTAEYYRETPTSDRQAVLADAKAAASVVEYNSLNVKAFSVFVAEFTSATWFNLDEVKQTIKRPSGF